MKVKCLIITAIALCLAGSAWADIANCPVPAAAYNTGTTDGATKTQDSLIIAGYVSEDGWVQVDTSAIPDTNNIVSVTLNYYINYVNYPYISFTPLENDPVTADAATLEADINAEATSGYYVRRTDTSSWVPGWYTQNLGAAAAADLQAGLATDRFAVGIAGTDNSTTYYMYVDGWNETNAPYIVVDHTSGSVPTCDDDLIDLGSMACSDTLTYTGSTVGANDWCGNPNGDAHFVFEALSDGEYTITTCSAITDFDTVLRLYDDECCGNEIAYNDQDSGCSYSVNDSKIQMALTAGTYYVHVEGYSSYEGNYELTITCAPPYDDCDTAFDMGGSGTVSGNNCSNNDTFTSYSCIGWTLLGPDQVYTVDLACPNAQVDITCTPTETWDPAIAVAFECSTGTLVCDYGADDAYEDEAESISFITTGDQVGTMYIFVDSYYPIGDGWECGNYDLTVTVDYGIPNDTCATAIDVSAGGVFAGDNCCAADDYDGNTCGFTWATPGPDVAYVLTLDATSTVDLTLTPTSSWDPAMYVVTDCADIAGSCVDGADAGYGGDPELLTLTDLPAGTYYIIADSYYDASSASSCGPFDLDVTFDTYDVDIQCLTPTLVLPDIASFHVDVTNTSAAAIQVSGGVYVTLCNGLEVGPVRSGYMTIPAGNSQGVSWTQPIIPVGYNGWKTCDCDLIWTVYSQDDFGGHTETDSCTVTTTCP